MASLQTIALPCLIFASVVPAFNSDNIRFLGPLCLNAVVYELCGLVSHFFGFSRLFESSLLILGSPGVTQVLGIVIREVFYVPSDFYYGIVIVSLVTNRAWTLYNKQLTIHPPLSLGLCLFKLGKPAHGCGTDDRHSGSF